MTKDDNIKHHYSLFRGAPGRVLEVSYGLIILDACYLLCVSLVSGVTGGDGIIISLGIWVTVLPSHKRQHV